MVTVAGTVGCDRVTKHVARSTLAGTPERSFLADSLRLVYVENTGGFLSVGADLPAVGSNRAVHRRDCCAASWSDRVRPPRPRPN